MKRVEGFRFNADAFQRRARPRAHHVVPVVFDRTPSYGSHSDHDGAGSGNNDEVGKAEELWDAARLRDELLSALDTAGCRPIDLVEYLDADASGLIPRRELLQRCKRWVLNASDDVSESTWHKRVRGAVDELCETVSARRAASGRGLDADDLLAWLQHDGTNEAGDSSTPLQPTPRTQLATPSTVPRRATNKPARRPPPGWVIPPPPTIFRDTTVERLACARQRGDPKVAQAAVRKAAAALASAVDEFCIRPPTPAPPHAPPPGTKRGLTTSRSAPAPLLRRAPTRPDLTSSATMPDNPAVPPYAYFSQRGTDVTRVRHGRLRLIARSRPYAPQCQPQTQPSLPHRPSPRWRTAPSLSTPCLVSTRSAAAGLPSAAPWSSPQQSASAEDLVATYTITSPPRDRLRRETESEVRSS